MSEAELKNSIVSMVVEAWRFAGVYQRLRVKLDFAGRSAVTASSNGFSRKRWKDLKPPT